MTRASRVAAAAVGVTVLIGFGAGCAATSRPVRPPVAVLMARAPALTSRASGATPTRNRRRHRATGDRALPMGRLITIARRRWAVEQYGPVVHRLLARVAADPILARALRSGDTHRIRAAVTRRFRPVWYHWHVSRLRVVRGRRAVVDVGVPFVVASSGIKVPGAHGFRLEISDQDVIGFVRFMHRNHGVDVVARGRTPTHVRTSLPAALGVHLPRRGTVTIARQRYRVGFFVRRSLRGERVRLWILARR